MNARFTFQDCKFTLKPGQSIEHWQGGPDDEGYSFRAFVLINPLAGGPVKAHLTSGGRDCDGEHRHYRDLELIRGEWIETGAEEYDQFAELMNY